MDASKGVRYVLPAGSVDCHRHQCRGPSHRWCTQWRSAAGQRTSDLLFGLDELVVHVTKYFTMLPGDVMITGTPSGVGTSKGLMKPGDVYEVTIEGIGTLRNRIVGLQ